MLFRSGELRDRPPDLEQAVPGAGAELHLLGDRAEQRAPHLVELTELLHLGGAHVGVAGELAVVKARVLQLARIDERFTNY